jgi:hypothetical protein
LPRYAQPVAVAVLLLTVACSDTTAKTESVAETVLGISPDDYDPSKFGDSANVSHRWSPLRPGTRLEYTGSSVEDGERLSHSLDISVTDLVKEIDGLPNIVVWECDYTEGELVETELALFAQDKDGNIWHMGEYPEEYEEGEFEKAPAWIHGLKGATAGVTIPVEPRGGNGRLRAGFRPRADQLGRSWPGVQDR